MAETSEDVSVHLDTLDPPSRDRQALPSELDALVAPVDDEEAQEQLLDSDVLKTAVAAFREAPQHLNSQLKLVGEALYAEESSPVDRQRYRMQTSGYRYELEATKKQAFIDAGTSPETAEKLAASIGRRSTAAETMAPDYKEKLCYLWEQVLVPWMHSELKRGDPSLAFEPEW